MTSTLKSVHPYLRVRLGERTQVWGATGWGRGGLELIRHGVKRGQSSTPASFGGGLACDWG